MANFQDPSGAAAYLDEHDYLDIDYNSGPNRVSYRDGTGDKTWEYMMADANGWSREEPGKCCFKNMKEMEALKPIRFCNECGRSVNGFVGWRMEAKQYPYDLKFSIEPNLEFLFKMTVRPDEK